MEFIKISLLIQTDQHWNANRNYRAFDRNYITLEKQQELFTMIDEITKNDNVIYRLSGKL